jgi:hypothetical protein
MVTTSLSRLRVEPINAHRFDLAVVRPTPGARRVAVDRELSTDMPTRSCVCQRSRSYSLE